MKEAGNLYHNPQEQPANPANLEHAYEQYRVILTQAGVTNIPTQEEMRRAFGSISDKTQREYFQTDFFNALNKLTATK